MGNDRGNSSHFSPSPDAISYNSDITTSSRSVDFDSLSLNSAELPLAYDDGVCVCVCVCVCVLYSIAIMKFKEVCMCECVCVYLSCTQLQ